MEVAKNNNETKLFYVLGRALKGEHVRKRKKRKYSSSGVKIKRREYKEAKYKGIYRHSGGSWTARIHKNGEQIYCGSCNTEEEAYILQQEKLKEFQDGN